MAFSVGVDIVHIPRIQRLVERYGHRYFVSSDSALLRLSVVMPSLLALASGSCSVPFILMKSVRLGTLNVEPIADINFSLQGTHMPMN
jgi:hypothetical protein